MKKTFRKLFSVAVAASMIFSGVGVSLFPSAETEPQTSAISEYSTTNDYDFTGDVVSYYHTGDLTTYMYCCAEKNDGNGANNNRWYPSVARYLGSKVEVITNGGIDNSACAKIHQARPVEAPYPAYIKIYDSHTYSTGIKTFENIKVMYEPLKNTRFKITFKYKRMAELTTDVTLSMRASTNVNTSESAKDHDRLGDFYTISAGNPDSDWQTAEGYFSVGDKDYKELFIIFSHAGSNNISTNIYIDDVQVDIARDININNFDDALNITNPIKYKDEGGYATWMARPDYADKDVDWNQWHFRLLSLNFVIEDGNGVEDSYGARIRTIKTEPSTYLKLYDDREDLSAWLPDAMFKPKQNTKYKLTFKYRVAKTFDTDVVFSVLGDTTSNDGPTLSNLLKLGKIFTLPANTAVSDEWKTAEGYFTTGATAYKELDFIVTSSKEYVQYNGLYIDDITVESVGTASQVNIVLHNYNSDGSDRTVTVNDDSELADLQIPDSEDKDFIGWYLDETFTTPAPSILSGITDLWAKWSTEPRTYVNSYDDPTICYGVHDSVATILYKNQSMKDIGFDWNKYHCRYLSSQILIEDGVGENGTRGARVLKAKANGSNWPANIKIYHSVNGDVANRFTLDKNFASFAPKKNTMYKVTFKYKVTEKLTQDLIFSLYGNTKLEDANDLKTTTDTLGTVYTIKAETEASETWKMAEGTITIGAQDYKELYLSVSSISEYINPGIYIDNITFTERLDVNYVSFETNGGVELDPIPFTADSPIALPLPKREGYMFAGWYNDSTLTESFNSANIQSADFKLYAKWESLREDSNELNTGFENDEYGSKKPYQLSNVNDNNKTKDVIWQSNDSANAADGDGYLSFNTTGKVNLETETLSAAAIMNKNGSYYQVVAGQRYKVTFDLYADYAHFVVFGISDRTPNLGLKSSDLKVLTTIRYHTEIDYSAEQWGTLVGSFKAEKTGKLYIATYGNEDNKGTLVNIDNLKVELLTESEASQVRFYTEDGNKLISSQFGLAGEPLLTPSISDYSKENYMFNGWRDDNGKQYIDAVFPTKDMDLFISYVPKETIGEVTPDWSSKKIFNFDKNTERAAAFYADGLNSYTAMSGLYLVGNDPEGAHSGSAYYKFLDAGHWYKEYYRRMKVFDPDSPGNLVYLEPHSVYRVNFWLKIDYSYQTALHVATMTIDGREILSTSLVDVFVDADIEDDYGMWKNYQGEIMTGDDPSALAFVLTAGYMTASLDDISVEYLRQVTITYDSNGGSEVEPQKWMLYDYAIAPDDPVREGYEFVGWFTDKELTKEYDFVKTEVPGDITLYAKWIPIVEEKDEYITITEYIYTEKEVENEIPDKELDEQIVYNNDDKIAAKNNTDTIVENPSPNVALIIIIAASVLLISCGVVVTVVLIRRKKKN